MKTIDTSTIGRLHRTARRSAVPAIKRPVDTDSAPQSEAFAAVADPACRGTSCMPAHSSSLGFPWRVANPDRRSYRHLHKVLTGAGHSRPDLPRWRSLRWRLPVFISGLMAAIVVLSLWATNRELERALLKTGGERAMAAADQVSALMAQATARGVNEVRRIAGDESLRRLLAKDADSDPEAVRRVLQPLAAAAQPPVELRAADGSLLLRVDPARGRPLDLNASLPLRDGLTPFFASGSTVFYGVVAEITDRRAAAKFTGPSAGTPLGYIVVRRVLNTAQTTETLNRLVGGGAFGPSGTRARASGRISRPSSRHRRWTRHKGRHDLPRGKRRDANRRAERDHRYAVVGLDKEFPRDRLLEPAYAVRRRMAAMGVGVLFVAAILVGVISGRITRPLQQLAAAATAIADGDYSHRVVIHRHDEIGRLGTAFSAMSTRVDVSRKDLELRVAERTATLSEARASLEQRVAELNVARAELNRFFSLSIDLLCIADCNGRLLRVNPAWEATLGWTADELTANPYLDFVHPDDRSATSSESEALADGSSTQHFENRYRCKRRIVSLVELACRAGTPGAFTLPPATSRREAVARNSKTGRRN